MRRPNASMATALPASGTKRPCGGVGDGVGDGRVVIEPENRRSGRRGDWIVGEQGEPLPRLCHELVPTCALGDSEARAAGSLVAMTGRSVIDYSSTHPERYSRDRITTW